MAEIKIISENRLRYVASEKGFNLIYMEKDYFITLALYLLKDLEGIVFKGGTALNKIFLGHTRLSEDLDFACRASLPEIRKKILKILEENENFFPKHKFENDLRQFFRLKIFYKSFFSDKNFIILDINRKASVILDPNLQAVPHFYEDIPKFGVSTLDIKELVAEKIRALITRNQPRDYFDVYKIIKAGHKIDSNMVKRKLKEANQSFEIERIFKNAQKVYSRWEYEMQLTNEPAKFGAVIKALQEFFKYKNK